MKFYKLVIITFLILFSFLLSACSKEATTENNEDKNKRTENSKDEPVEGGTITGAMYDTPTGMFNPLFYEDAYEKNILDFTHEALFVQNEQLEYEGQLAKEGWKLNKDQTELTIRLEDDITWHDGKSFTADDVVFTYQTISDPDYIKAGGIRSNYATALLGYDDYSAGETDDFEGVVAEDDQTVTFKFSEPNVTPEYIASFPIIPKHIFEDIPVIDIPKADESREPDLVIGTGPFKFSDMVEREKYVLEKYKNYWKDEPYLDQITWKVVEPSMITNLLKTGDIDFIANPDSIYPASVDRVRGYEDIEIIEQPDFYYQFLGFKHNHRTPEDVEAGIIAPDNWVSNDKLPQEVRQAIAYAIDRTALIGEGHGDGLLHGNGQLMNAPIATQSWAYDDESAINYSYNPEKAKKILDDAGFKMNNDGDRTNPDGDEWVLNMEYPIGDELRERAAPLIKEHLENVGINVNLRQPKEMSTFVSKLMNDDNDLDLFLLGSDLNSSDPDPLGTWGTEDVYNFSRWNNPKSDVLLEEALETPDAFKQDYRTKTYVKWQHLFSDDLPALPLFTQNNLWAYTDRLHGIEPLPYTMYNDAHLWWVDNNK